MFFKAYKQAFSVLAKKPLLLWGLSLLCSIICALGIILTLPVLMIVGVGFGLVVGAGMAKVYLDALDEKTVNSDQLFAGFKRFWTVLGGVAWKILWIAIWSCIAVAAAAIGASFFVLIAYSFRAIPAVANVLLTVAEWVGIIILAAGEVFVLIKSYSYSFVEYILMTQPNVTATQALRKSVEMTKTIKWQILLADVIFGAAIAITAVILSLLTWIPYAGFLFGIIAVVFFVVVGLLGNLFRGLYSAAFYKMATEPQEEKKPEENNQ